jgi:hypothetical protein
VRARLGAEADTLSATLPSYWRSPLAKNGSAGLLERGDLEIRGLTHDA